MPELSLPEPKNWAEAGKRTLWAGLMVSVGMVYFVVRGIFAGLRGNYLTTVLIFGFITFPVLMMAALLLVGAGETRTRTSSDATGLTVWPDKRFSMLYLTGLAAFDPSALLLAFFIPRGAIDIPMSRGLQIFSPALFAAAGVFATFGLISWVRRGGVGYLKFSPTMVEIADVIKTRAVEWADIVDIKDQSETKDGKSTGRSVVLCSAPSVSRPDPMPVEQGNVQPGAGSSGLGVRLGWPTLRRTGLSVVDATMRGSFRCQEVVMKSALIAAATVGIAIAVSPVVSAEPPWTMPNLIGMDLQGAQDAVQSLTRGEVWFSSSTDLTGKGRAQISDRNWQVCSSTPPPGAKFTVNTAIDFGVVRIDREKCP